MNTVIAYRKRAVGGASGPTSSLTERNLRGSICFLDRAIADLEQIACTSPSDGTTRILSTARALRRELHRMKSQAAMGIEEMAMVRDELRLLDADIRRHYRTNPQNHSAAS